VKTFALQHVSCQNKLVDTQHM